MATVASLVVKIRADAKEFQKGMENVSKKMQDVGKSMQKAGSTLTKSVTLPIIAAGSAVFGMGVKMGNLADEILDLRSITGMSTDAIQEWQAVADRAGVATDAVTNASEALTRSMARGAEGSADMRLGLQELGLSLDDMRELTPDDKMRTLITSLQGVEDASKRAELGNRLLRGSYSQLAPILDMTAKEMEEVINQAYESGRIIDEDALNAANEFRKGLDKLKNEFMGLFYSIGNNFMPLLTGELIPAIKEHVIPIIRNFGETIGSVIKWFADLDPEWQKTILIAIGFAAALGPVLLIAGKLVTAIGALIPIIGAVATPVGAVVAAVGLLVAGLIYLWKTNEGFRDAVISIWENIKSFAISIFQSIQDFWDEWGDTIIQTFKDIWETVSTVFMYVFEIIKSYVTTIFNALKNFWDEWGDTIIEGFKTYLNILWTIWSTIFKTVFDVVVWIFNEIRDFWDEWGDTIVEAFKNIFEILSILWNVTFGVIMAVTISIFERLQKFWDKWGDLITATFKTTFEVVKNIFITVWEIIKNVVQTVVGVVSNTIKFWLAILQGDWAGAWEAIKGIFMAVWDGIGKHFEIIIDHFLRMFGVFKDGLVGIWNGIWTAIKSVINNIISEINTMMSGISKAMNAVSGLWNKIPGVNIPDVKAPQIPKLHTGTDYFRPAGGAMEGLALLKRGEKVIPPGESEATTINMNITYNVSDRATAEYANEDLLRKLQGRGLAGAFR